MTWKLGGVRIYVEEDSGWKSEPRRGTIDLLDTDYTIIHDAGTRSLQRDITFVVFSGYYNDIMPLVASGTILFEDDDGTTTNVAIMNDLSPTRLYDYFDRKIHRVKASLMKVDT
jgi:hypothetical protein